MSDESLRDQSAVQQDTTPTTADSSTEGPAETQDLAIEAPSDSPAEQTEVVTTEITEDAEEQTTKLEETDKAEPAVEPPQESAKEEKQEEKEEEQTPVQPPEDQQEDFTEAGDDQSAPLPKIVTDLHNDTRGSRALSIASTTSVGSRNSVTIETVKSTIIRISEQKEVKKNPLLAASTKKSIDRLSTGFDTAQVFDTLRLSIESQISEVVILALDCITKIFTYNLFEPIQVAPSKTNTALTDDPDAPAGSNLVTPPPRVNLIDAAIDTIANAFQGEGTDQKIEVQVVRALMTGVLNETLPAHGSTLLKAVRQIYNIFILSVNSANQSIAQASLTQVVNVVFDKVEKIPNLKEAASKSDAASVNDPTDSSTKESLPGTPAVEGEEPLKLENLKSLNDEEERLVDQSNDDGDENDLIVKDAFLLFRAMCKLSVKTLDNDSIDMRSHAVRSKLISLHIIHSIIKEHIDVFLSNDIAIHSPTSKEATVFVDAVRQYLCLSISRNAASAISPVFETTLEVFWLIISNLRYQFKREIPVFLWEIYFPIAELKTSTAHQKRYFLVVVQRICNDPRTLIEFYLNYDCDSSQPNITEKVTNYLTKLALTRVEITPKQKAEYREASRKPISTYNLSQLPMLSINKLNSQAALADAALPYPVEYALKVTSLKCIVGILRSLNSWAQKGMTPNTRASSIMERKRSSTNTSAPISPAVLAMDEVDDPQEFESLKQRKTLLQEGIRKFNFKAKKGITYLIQNHFIESNKPTDIAKFLLDQPGLDKAVIGEYLGEGDDDNIAIMHAFVDLMDFTGLSFTEAMRRFLQSFRLPGEAQKIDRYMLKFAERYLDGNPGVFANADTAYVLSYSVIMLNTDQHSKNVKNKMTLDDFLKNNRGIDDGKDIPAEYLTSIFNEIQNNEIKLQSEQHAALLAGDLAPPTQQGFGLFSGRDINREAYNKASKEISSKTEKLFKSLGRNRGSATVFYSASHIEHVKSIFDNLWMSFLACLTTLFRDENEAEIDEACLEGMRLAISISAIFDLDYNKATFIGALVTFCNLMNVSELKDKNIDAVLLLFKCGEIHGNQLKSSWQDVLTIVSQVERLQLISKGIQADVVPDVANAKMHRTSMDSTRSHQTTTGFFGFGKKTTLTEQAQIAHHNQHLDPHIGQRLTSSEVSVAIDKIFTQSSQLNGTAIVEFIKALTEVAFEEIESSSDSTTPRTFSLQKVIDVCHYNMGRIRVEYTNIWNVISEFFQKITNKDYNLSVLFFALDSLRQLSMRFMDIEELAGFKFQLDFLKPFEYILKHAKDVQVTEMVLNCLNNLIMLKGPKIKSGWKTIFSALEYTATDNNEQVAWKTYEIVDSTYKEHHESILMQDEAFTEMISVLRELAKNSKFQKISLQSLHKTKQIFVKIAEVTLSAKEDDPLLKHHKDVFKDLWYPGLSCFNEVIMTGDDLEVRSRALNYMFDVLVQFGGRFDHAFWDQVCVNLLFPIFSVLSKHWEVNQFTSHDDLSVWLSTTLIQALRNMIALFTHYFDALSRMMDGYLDLLISCICQENDTIARIGRSCFQQLITQNMQKFEQAHWDKITGAFEKLFDLTTAKELFEADPLKKVNGEVNGSRENGENGNGHVSPLVRTKSTEELRAKAKSKNAIVVKCVLQLLMIETLSELFEDEEFYQLIPYENLTRLSGLLEKSFRFARKFNDDYNLRVRLWESGVIDKLPSLLKQESSSSAVFINATFKLYRDNDKITQKQKDTISASLIPMCVSIVERYVSLDDNTQLKNISTWRPVVVEILQGYCELEEKDFNKNCPHVYDLVLDILDKSVPSELRTAIKAFFARVGDVYIKEEKN
ncbi:CYFA0S02e00232g1_1 [Cyberlindnera fabianii]|uniref:CYFA0S02e00232g1_1 n=1 Tax=Cyberlindnera fabianii TaxID=36022 RepID=A0A061ASG0_CYBFA|nr:Protein transport protein SEC7 [Cyberlindnera fabianii]CDR38317.1 CYFA0S02e00232g1_1 [Cyberlindnera fabianii]